MSSNKNNFFKLSSIGVISTIVGLLLQSQLRSQTIAKTTRTIERDVLCSKFPLNSNCLQDPPEVIKISLADYGAKDEWIRIDKTGNHVKVYFTRQNDGGFIGRAIDGGISSISPYPIPFSLAPRPWSDRQTTTITFKSDRCTGDRQIENLDLNLILSNCTVSGTETLVLTDNLDIRQGLFTLEYIEGELVRSISFRIPQKAKSEIPPVVIEYD